MSEAVGSDADQQRRFHRWKALTTDLVGALASQSSREERIQDIVEELWDMLEPLRRKLASSSAQHELRKIVENAITLDETFCGQQAWYHLEYPQPRFNGAVTDDIEVVGKSGIPSRRANFVVQPAFCCSGRERQRDYNQHFILEGAQVCVC